MSTDLASTGTLTLDPVFPFGLIKTTSKTVTYTKTDYPAIELKSGLSFNCPANSPAYAFHIKNISFTQGLTDIYVYVTVYFRVPDLYISPPQDLGIVSGTGDVTGIEYLIELRDEAGNRVATPYARIKNVTSGAERTIGLNGAGAVTVREGDYFEVEYAVPLANVTKASIMLNPRGNGFYISELQYFYNLAVSCRHDGTLTRGDTASIIFDVYDTDDVTKVGTIEVDGVVSPYDFTRHDYMATYKAGAMNTYVVPIGTWALKSGATGIYARLSMDAVKVQGTDIPIDQIENYFDTLEVDLMHKDEYENIVSMPVCELITGGVLKQTSIPFNSSDELLPDGKGGNCALVCYVQPKRVAEILGKRIEVNTSLWIVM